ncbi:uroporphyrinogen decarboxylase family protein [Fontivita pretiosa]|uniref:uroporphyrinogen decarboxylase family protein n=1 Tax=Fontivita pretiosa TaxID=2989684 RepID=UPI003D182ECD
MSPVERVEAVLSGRQPDRPPFSFWHHFSPDQIHGPAAVRAHLDLLEEYQLDFLKVMNDNGYPHHVPIRSIDDLASLKPLGGQEPEFARQIDLIAELRRQTRGRVLMSTTIFNAWAVLRQLIQPPQQHQPPNLDASADAPSRWIRQAWATNPGAVESALQTIAGNLANFARRCLAAGADGIYLSVRDDWVETPEHPDLYRRLVRPADEQILAAASEARFNILHVCGRPRDLRGLSRMPHVHAVSWADRAAGPAIAQVRDWLGPAICAGVDNLNTLANGSPEDVRRQVHDALAQAAGRPIIIAPGCTFDPRRVPPQNLRALAEACISSSY